jgi:hypothetical protein
MRSAEEFRAWLRKLVQEPRDATPTEAARPSATPEPLGELDAFYMRREAEMIAKRLKEGDQ